MRGRVFGRDAADGVSRARDKGHPSAAADELADERQTQPRGAARHGEVEVQEQVPWHASHG